jgi:hypothetical protein
MRKAALAPILTVFTSCVPDRIGYYTNTYIIDSLKKDLSISDNW